MNELHALNTVYVYTYMIKVPAAKRPAEMVSKVTTGYATVGIGALIGEPAVQSS